MQFFTRKSAIRFWICLLVCNTYSFVNGKPFVFNPAEAIGQVLSASQNFMQSVSSIVDYRNQSGQNNTDLDETTSAEHETLLQKKVDFVVEKLRRLNSQIGSLSYESDANDSNNSSLIQRKVDYIVDKFRQLNTQFSTSDTAPEENTEQPGEVQQNVDRFLQRIRFYNNVESEVQKIDAKGESQEVDSWEDFDDDVNGSTASQSKGLSPETVGFFVLEIFGSLAGIVLGALGQISLGLNQAQNLTSIEG